MLFGKEISILNELEIDGKKVDDDEETTDYTVDNEDDDTDDLHGQAYDHALGKQTQ